MIVLVTFLFIQVAVIVADAYTQPSSTCANEAIAFSFFLLLFQKIDRHYPARHVIFRLQVRFVGIANVQWIMLITIIHNIPQFFHYNILSGSDC